ncbi:MAG: hypothetical protein EXR82_04035 [Gammaproteobacteria bacterium]|nr:hypothetical protein [Gammaproteobacteria bacterium]
MFQSTFRSTATAATATAGLLLAAGLAGLPAAHGQEALEKAGVSRIEELVTFVPNFAMSETSIGTNQGFEQSVGIYVDGIYYGRGQLARAQ